MIQTELTIDPLFFEEEVRCGFPVTRQRKELWAVELDLLYKFDEICRAYNLKYCVGAGTMLGAVRHKGFIPWDDDIDVYMIRGDYDKLSSLSSAFQYPYFLQNSTTEKDLLRSFTRLRNSRTTGYTKLDGCLSINKGIFIDIFPLDGVNENRILNFKQYVVNEWYTNLYYCYIANRFSSLPSEWKQIMKIPIKKLIAFFIRDKMKLYRAYESNLKKYSVEGTTVWGNRSLHFNCPRSRRPLQDYLDVIYMPFEFMEVPVPRNYDDMLRQQYGDYRKIPENKSGTIHGELTVSVDCSSDEFKRSDL